MRYLRHTFRSYKQTTNT